ncbi:flippase-like domain-containing protein [Candidatus Saccharibacteria bacterium]|nr:flippase-like domain-containing protein [Candidatus Saccharibacteria bacterium]
MSEVESKTKDSSLGLKKRRQKIFLVVLFVLINVAVIAATAISEFGNSKNATEFSEIRIDWWLLIPAALCFIVAITAEIFKYVLMIREMPSKENGKKIDDWKLARRTVLLGRYYDNVTPAAVGGQPFQIYYMRKNSGLSKGASTAVPIFGMISLQIAFIMIALICFLFGGVAGDHPVLIVTAWIGLLFYAFWPVMVIGASFFPKFTTKVTKLFVKILVKFKILKNREEKLAKVEDEIKEYAKSVKMILKTPGLFVKVILLSLVFNLLVAMIPFFVLTAFGGNVGFWASLGTTIAVMSAVYFIPTPGNSGAAEGTFFIVFSTLSSGYVFWAMLIWRFFSYYIYILMGPIIYFVMHLEKKHGRIE